MGKLRQKASQNEAGPAWEQGDLTRKPTLLVKMLYCLQSALILTFSIIYHIHTHTHTHALLNAIIIWIFFFYWQWLHLRWTSLAMILREHKAHLKIELKNIQPQYIITVIRTNVINVRNLYKRSLKFLNLNFLMKITLSWMNKGASF